LCVQLDARYYLTLVVSIPNFKELCFRFWDCKGTKLFQTSKLFSKNIFDFFSPSYILQKQEESISSVKTDSSENLNLLPFCNKPFFQNGTQRYAHRLPFSKFFFNFFSEFYSNRPKHALVDIFI